MANVAVLVPYLDMKEMASEMIRDCPHVDRYTVEYYHLAEVPDEAKRLEEEGYDLIIARIVHRNFHINAFYPGQFFLYFV